jgi:hypothetical protein
VFSLFQTDENENKLRHFLAKFPENLLRKKFKTLNIIVYIIWTFFTLAALIDLFETINARSGFEFLFLIFVAIGLIKFNGDVYLLAILYFIWALIGLYFDIIRMTEAEWEEEGSAEATYITIGIIIVAIIFMIIFLHFTFSTISSIKIGQIIT